MSDTYEVIYRGGLYKVVNSRTSEILAVADTPETAHDAIRILTESGSPLKGRKDDQGKDRFELLPPELLFGVARVLTFGAKKYADRNWEQGMAWGRPFGALMRHMWCWWGGKGPTATSFLFGDLDDETKFSHLWHAGCCLAFLIAYEERKTGTDDRFSGQTPASPGRASP